MNRFVVIMAILVIGFGVIVYLNQQEPPETGDPSSHIVGEGTSGVTLIEYADFQCPACGQYYPIVDAVKDIYGDEVSFQFRHFPLIGSFPNSMSAHRAAEAAGLQGQFWEMHGLIFERQEAWSPANNAAEIFQGYAEELGLDMERYNEDISSSETLATINADRARADEQGVTGTPTFFINEERIESPRDPSAFFEIIDEYIERETGEPSVNSPRSQDDVTDPFTEGALPEGVDLEDVEQTQDGAAEIE